MSFGIELFVIEGNLNGDIYSVCVRAEGVMCSVLSKSVLQIPALILTQMNVIQS